MTAPAALAGLRVVDFSNQRTGAQVSQLLADFGAEVILIEPKGGSALRAERAWPIWGRGKRSIELDLKDAADLSVAQSLAVDADIVIETFRPGVADRLGIGYATLSARNPGLIFASISGFGSDGPLAGLQGYEGIVAAKLGVFQALTDMAPEPGRPAFCSVAYASYPASQLALQGIFAALLVRENGGGGQHVETTLAQGLTVHDTFNWFSRVVATRYGEGFKQMPRVHDGVPTGDLSFRLLIAFTKDGRWLQFSQTTNKLFRAMMKMFGLEWMFDDPKWASAPAFDSHEQRREFWEILLNIVRGKTAAEWAALFDDDPNVWAEMFRRGSELLDHPQMVWNGMVDLVDKPEGVTQRRLGALVRMETTPAVVDGIAPASGAHDATIRAEVAAMVATDSRSNTQKKPTTAPLSGITIVELGTYYAAPFGATLLADLGARVIKLEQLDGDPHRFMLPFPELAGMKVLQGKESVAVDLPSAEGRAIAHRIIASADIVLQSFRAGVAKRLGLDADTLIALNPKLIYLNAPGYGEDGPCGHRPAFAPTIGACAGMAWRNAEATVPDRNDLSLDEIKETAIRLSAAVMGVGNADGLSGVSTATAMLLGLVARARGAGGQKMLTSMLSSTAHALSEVMVDYDGAPPAPTADAGLHGFSALYRLYRASDDWVFLAAPGRREWDRLAAALPGGRALAEDLRFALVESRAANDTALADELAAILATRTADEWETALRAADVACVKCAPGPVEANYLDEGSVGQVQNYVTATTHPVLDDVPRLAALIHFSESPTDARGASLCGQDTAAVLSEFGYSEGDVSRMAEDKVVLCA
ncbi:MAG: CoA transferase [Sphingomonadales bacterium]|nr:CoA transferase [Sphingomonadales bacterium]